MNSSFSAFAVVAGLACAACGDTSRTERASELLWLSQSAPAVWLFAVDDVEDAPGVELRERLWSDLARRNAESPSCGDPAAYYAIDRRAVVLHPSGTGFVAPDSNPALAVTTTHDTLDARTVWLDGVRRATDDGIVAPATSPYAFLSRLSDAVSLLVGKRSPAADEEQKMLDALRSTSELVVVAVTAHDDQSAGAPESFAIQLDASAGNFSAIRRESLAFPSTDGQPCTRAQLTTERYSQWLAASSAPFEQPDLWRPGDDCSLVPDLKAACGHACLSVQPHFSSQGEANCHIYVALDPNEGCPESRGLMPSNARVPEMNGPVCEMRQLQAAALQSCRNDLECADCEPGFCFTAIPALVEGCASVGKVASPRFVNGAANVPSRKVYISCE